MKSRGYPLKCLILGLAAAASLGPRAQAAEALDPAQQTMVEDYCASCHNFEDFAGGLAFDLLEAEHLTDNAETWEAVIRKLKAGMMPPPGNERPAPVQVENFLASLEESIDGAAGAEPRPGAPLLHRLNRTEYQNAVRDLLGLEIEAADMLPADDSSGGFDNIANVLSISPALMQSYIAAAAHISRLAIGDPTITAGTTSYRAPEGSQAQHREEMALGTRGGVAVDHVFPLDAEYEISIGRSGANAAFSLNPVNTRDPVELVIDGERIRIFPPGGPARIQLPIPAGTHRVEAAFLHTQAGLGVDDLHNVWADSTRVTSLSINGPINPTGPGDTATRRRIFVCTPEAPSAEEACAERILERLATRAYRRPVDEASLNILLDFFRDGRELRGFDAGIQYALARVLVDPQFIFRFEAEPRGLAEGELYRIDDYELASRLSFFLWSSIPDDSLLEAAGAGRLSDPAELERQVRRMLADPRADALVENFATQWLSLRRLTTFNPISTEFDGNLREAMRRETLMLFEHVLREDRSVLELLDADYSFLNERLARHYGLNNVRGSHFRKVALPDGTRRGLLGHASILTITSAPNRTSPVIRGTWVLENLLGTPPPPPPPGVETNLEETSPAGTAPTTIRERLERHRADPACAACHDVIDPIGFALESYDQIGMWRDKIGTAPVNTEARLWDGTTMHGPEGLRRALLERSELFVETLAEKLMTYALGRTVEYYDMPAIRAVVKKTEAGGYSLGALILGIVETPAFQMRMKESPALSGGLAGNDSDNEG